MKKTTTTMNFVPGVSISLEDLFSKYSHITFTGVVAMQKALGFEKVRRLGMRKGVLSDYKKEYESMKWQYGSVVPIESFIESCITLSETAARTIWIITHTSPADPFPEIPNELLCEIYVRRLMRGFQIDNSSIDSISNGNVACKKTALIWKMRDFKIFDDKKINSIVDRLCIELDDDYIILKSLHDEELALIDTLKSLVDTQINKLNTVSFDKFMPNSAQLDALRPNCCLLPIFGPPGSGKTTVAGYAYNAFTYKSKNAIVCAPTHAAKDRLNQKDNIRDILHEINDGEVKTLDSLYYTIFSKKRKDVKYIDTVLIIDECSMIGNNSYSKLRSIINRINPKAVIFLGDADQLPPVRQPGSLVKLLSHFNVTKKLVKCERTSSKDIVNYYKKVLSDKTIQNEFSDGILKINDTVLENINDAVEEFTKTFNKNDINSVVACFENKYVDKINCEILKRLLTDNVIKHNIDESDINEVCEGIRSESKETRDNAIFSLLCKGLRIIVCNNNDPLVKNGEIGMITNVKHFGSYATIEMNNKAFNLSLTNASTDIKPFYASTIHKLQGTEFDNVFYVKGDNDNVALAYTACSRAKSLLKVFSTPYLELNACWNILTLQDFIKE